MLGKALNVMRLIPLCFSVLMPHFIFLKHDNVVQGKLVHVNIKHSFYLNLIMMSVFSFLNFNLSGLQLKYLYLC
jgi:hypothetical protein